MAAKKTTRRLSVTWRPQAAAPCAIWLAPYSESTTTAANAPLPLPPLPSLSLAASSPAPPTAALVPRVPLSQRPPPPRPPCTWWATSERRWRAGASLQPTGRPPGDSHGSRSLCWRRVYVTVTFPYGAAHGCRRLPLLEAGAGGFLASPASRGVGLPSRHLGGSMRAAWGRSERAPPPPGLESAPRGPLQPLSSSSGAAVIVLATVLGRGNERF